MIQTIGWAIVGCVIGGLVANMGWMLWRMWREGDQVAGWALLSIIMVSIGLALVAFGGSQ